MHSRRGRQRSPDTYISYAASVATYLGYLAAEGLLDSEATLAAQVTPERADDYLEWLLRHGNAPHSIAGHLRSLRASLQMMHPREDFVFVTRPGGLPLQHRESDNEVKYTPFCAQVRRSHRPFAPALALMLMLVVV